MKDVLMRIANHRGTLMTLLIAALPIVLIQPMSPIILDVLLSLNIALAVLVMLTCMYIEKPLEFSAFPSLLLVVTLFRLVLNVASTRLILGDAYAGDVISTFAEFVAGGSLVIGVVIFFILVIIQFIVITKGATRIAEVAARFTLDAMPGKQMAIDADLNSGMIDESTARQRREEIASEAEFYGAMDGASKFVRGDAIAGIVITLVNIVGGIVAGMVMLDLSLGNALETFVKLSIGDGLVSQIPAFLIAIASGLLVTRTGKQGALGDELIRQIFGDYKPVLLASGFLLTLALVTDLPAMPLLTMAVGLILVGYSLNKSRQQLEQVEMEAETKQRDETAAPRPEQFLEMDVMELEVGYGLIRLCDVAKGGDLVERIRMIRQQMAAELGFIVPSIRVHDNMQLDQNAYRVKIKGVEVAQGECHADSCLAMDTGLASGELDGLPTQEPAFGMPALWISPLQKDQAEAQGYQIVDATSVMVTHLIEVLKTHCHHLLTRQEVSGLVENLRQRASRVVEDTVDAKLVTMGDIQRVLQLLLMERVSIRDLESILEVIGDYAPRLKGNDGAVDHEVLADYVRVRLGRAICQSVMGSDGHLHVAMLEPRLEDALIGGVRRSVTRRTIELPPDDQKAVISAILTQLEKLVTGGYSPVLVVDPAIRRQIYAMLMRSMPSLVVLGTVEIPPAVDLTGEAIVLLPDSLKLAEAS